MKLIQIYSLLSFILSSHVMASEITPNNIEAATLVEVAKVEARTLAPKTMITGSVKPRYYGELTAGLAGKLKWIADAGSNVKHNDVIAKLDDRRLLLQQTEQQAQIEYETVVLNREQANFERISQLTSNISLSELDQVRSERDLAATKLKLAKIKLALIQDELAKTHIRAPFDGIITQRLRQIGEDVAASSAILSMLNPLELEIHLYAPLKYYQRVKVGEQLRIFHAQGSFKAPIHYLIPVSSNDSQTFEARISIPKEQLPHVNIGEIVSLEMPIAPKRLSLLVPRDALVLRSNEHYVVKINQDNQAEKIPVAIGEGEGDWIAITSRKPRALKAQDIVVIRGAETLKAAQRVKYTTTAAQSQSASTS
ncbi:efflux RND transporter periplasmic adaptor subunit [uncultured Shewanella sp.]|uniref:efflux RND transporter periplasmic adaptor subunit n=1 Tax=uncultured Shewanella sp. TaxID=173975 RepID=UPI002632235D|nr:efflux RND transporter periplasmic adaptor subunit [uncultured Shewanella sp.]